MPKLAPLDGAEAAAQLQRIADGYETRAAAERGLFESQGGLDDDGHRLNRGLVVIARHVVETFKKSGLYSFRVPVSVQVDTLNMWLMNKHFSAL